MQSEGHTFLLSLLNSASCNSRLQIFPGFVNNLVFLSFFAVNIQHMFKTGPKTFFTPHDLFSQSCMFSGANDVTNYILIA